MAVFIHVVILGIILDCLGQVICRFVIGQSSPYKGDSARFFLKWRRVTRPLLIFRGLTGSQRTPGFWGVTAHPPSMLAPLVIEGFAPHKNSFSFHSAQIIHESYLK